MKFWFVALLGIRSGRTRPDRVVDDPPAGGVSDDDEHAVHAGDSTCFLPGTKMASNQRQCLHVSECCSNTTKESIMGTGFSERIEVCGCLHHDEPSPHSSIPLTNEMCCSHRMKETANGLVCDCIRGGDDSWPYELLEMVASDCCSGLTENLGTSDADLALSEKELEIWHSHIPFGTASDETELKKCAKEVCVHKGHPNPDGGHCCGGAEMVGDQCGCVSTHTVLEMQHELAESTDCCGGEMSEDTQQCMCINDGVILDHGAQGTRDCCSGEAVTVTLEGSTHEICKSATCEPLGYEHHLQAHQHCCQESDPPVLEFYTANPEHFNNRGSGYCPCIHPQKPMYENNVYTCCSHAADHLDPSLCAYGGTVPGGGGGGEDTNGGGGGGDGGGGGGEDGEDDEDNGAAVDGGGGGHDEGGTDDESYHDIVPEGIDEEHYCFSGNATILSDHKYCNCVLPAGVLTFLPEADPVALDHVARDHCCSGTRRYSGIRCGCIPLGIQLHAHDTTNWIDFSKHCCSRNGEQHHCTCAPPGVQLIDIVQGRHETGECCSGISQDGICACLGQDDEIPHGQDASHVCCSKHGDDSGCSCISDGVLLEKGTPDSACCSNQSSHVISDACSIPPKKCGA